MNTSVVNVTSNIAKGLQIKAPAILTGFAIGGTITTMYLGAKAGSRARQRLEIAVEEYNKELRRESLNPVYYEDPEDIPLKDQVMICWKDFIPAILSGGLTIGCIVGAHKVHIKRETALIMGYEISRNLLNNYRARVRELESPRKVEEIENAVIRDRVHDICSDPENIVSISGEEPNVIITDPFTGVVFRANMEAVGQAINRCNARLVSEMWISINEVYDEISEKIICPPAYDIFGWEAGSVIEFNWDVTKLPNNEIAHSMLWKDLPGVDKRAVIDKARW